MTAVDECGQTLAGLPYGCRKIDGEELPVPHEDAPVDDRGADVGGAGAVHEGGGEVVDGLGVRARDVHEDDVGAPAGGEEPGAFQHLDGRDAVPGEAVVGLVAALGGVEVDGQTVFAGELGSRGEVGVVDGAGGVRGERGSDATAGAVPVP